VLIRPLHRQNEDRSDSSMGSCIYINLVLLGSNITTL
jgi:hypothetical protein